MVEEIGERPGHERTCVQSGFLGFHTGFMEAFECGKEACSAGRAASGALDSAIRHRVVLPLTCGLFGCMSCMSVTQRRQHTAEEPLVGQGGQKRAFHKPMIVH